MTDEKICPFMSRCEIQPDGDHLLATTYCQKERCAAWAKINRRFDGNGNLVVVEASFGCRLIPWPITTLPRITFSVRIVDIITTDPGNLNWQIGGTQYAVNRAIKHSMLGLKLPFHITVTRFCHHERGTETLPGKTNNGQKSGPWRKPWTHWTAT